MYSEIYMRRALTLAEKGAGCVSTNPMVGAVIVSRGKIIGEGYHHRCGEAHAEVNAVNSVREEDRPLLRDSVLYVTLEPCCHYGKTPPCTELILSTGIGNVVIAMSDPFAKVAGEGINILRAHGVNVQVGMLAAEAAFLNRRFITFHTKSRPYVILKWAETADGYIDSDRAANEPAQWLTGYAAKVMVHRWRAEEDAILVGANTVLRDNPSLDVREWFGTNPIRVTIDKKGTLPANANIFNSTAETICYPTEDVEYIL
ncbi:MAG: bifunctional diaminohydroxyphosphoribosylaminopyrimidine deaminase/5-amino-6-(5-phosphoribosylamino)uracil reductase RibD, partial [Rikenellaceae bacterium]